MDEVTERLLLENKLTEIRYIKQQQRQVLYFAFLAIGAITTLALTFGNCQYEFRNFLIFFSFLIAGIGCILVLHYFRELMKSISEKRTHLENLKYPDNDEDFRWDTLVTVIFCGVIALSLAASIYSILLRCR